MSDGIDILQVVKDYIKVLGAEMSQMVFVKKYGISYRRFTEIAYSPLGAKEKAIGQLQAENASLNRKWAKGHTKFFEHEKLLRGKNTKLQTDLEAANKRIKDLEAQLKAQSRYNEHRPGKL